MACWVAGVGTVMAAAAVMAMAAAAAVVAAAAAAAVAVAARATAAVAAAAGVGLAATAMEAVAGVGLAATVAAAVVGVGSAAAAAREEQASRMILPGSRRRKLDTCLRLRLDRCQSDNSLYTTLHTVPTRNHLECTDYFRTDGDWLGSTPTGNGG